MDVDLSCGDDGSEGEVAGCAAAAPAAATTASSISSSSVREVFSATAFVEDDGTVQLSFCDDGSGVGSVGATARRLAAELERRSKNSRVGNSQQQLYVSMEFADEHRHPHRREG